MLEYMRNAACEHMTLDEQISFCEEKSKNIKLKTEPQTFVNIKNSLEKLKNPWIPVSERLPECCGYPVLLTVENKFNQRFVCKAFTNYMKEGKPLFYTNEKEYCKELASNKLSNAWKPIAWMPLPEPYSADSEKPQTNADRIRSMTDEELAVNMMCPNENGLAEIDCDKNDNCNCYECLLKWLRAESEE